MLDLTKPVTTRDGREARVYATDAGGDYPVHGAVWDTQRGVWTPEIWELDGSYWISSDRLRKHDLINPPARFRFERWAVVSRSTVDPRKFIIQGTFDSEPIKLWTGQQSVKFVIEGEEA